MPNYLIEMNTSKRKSRIPKKQNEWKSFS